MRNVTDVEVTEIQHFRGKADIRKMTIFCLDNRHISARTIIFLILQHDLINHVT